jgi:hypothetical protein
VVVVTVVSDTVHTSRSRPASERDTSWQSSVSVALPTHDRSRVVETVVNASRSVSIAGERLSSNETAAAWNAGSREEGD